MIDGVRDAGRPVAAVERAIALMDVLADGGGPRGVNDLARALGAHASTVSRLLGTLSEAGLVERDAASGRYRLGLRVAHWGSAAVAGRDLRELARPLLTELAALSGETATLSLAAGTEALTADYVASSQTVLSQARVGRASVGHATAVGKVLLAYRPDALAALPAELEAFTEGTIVDRAALERELASVRARRATPRRARSASPGCTRSRCRCSTAAASSRRSWGCRGPIASTQRRAPARSSRCSNARGVSARRC